MSVKDIENMFDDKLGDLSEFSPYSDYNLGLYANSLDSYISAWKRDGVPMKFYAFQYDGTTYYSVQTRIVGSQVVLELFSKNVPKNAEDIENTDEVRMSFVSVPSISSNRLEALQVSRASSNVTKITKYYKAVFGVDPIYTQTTRKNAKIVVFQLNRQATVQIRYVQRPVTHGEVHSIKWFEDYLNGVHEKYMTSYNSCWDIWGDNHYALDSMNVNGDNIVSLYEKNGWKYHMFGQASKKGKGLRGPGGHINGYFVTPTGWQIQLDVQFSSCNNCDSFSPQLCTTSCV